MKLTEKLHEVRNNSKLQLAVPLGMLAVVTAFGVADKGPKDFASDMYHWSTDPVVDAYNIVRDFMNPPEPRAPVPRISVNDPSVQIPSFGQPVPGNLDVQSRT